MQRVKEKHVEKSNLLKVCRACSDKFCYRVEILLFQVGEKKKDRPNVPVECTPSACSHIS